MHERSSPEILPKETLSTVVKDFYYSFWFSQASEELQEKLWQGVAANYSSGTLNHIRLNADELQDRIHELRLPASHVAVDESDITNEFDRLGEKFLARMLMNEPKPLNTADLSTIVSEMIRRDDQYQYYEADEDRKYRNADPRQSHFREFVLLATPTGSVAYDAIFRDVKQAYLSGEIDKRALLFLDELRREWEHNHTGEMFFPEDISGIHR